MSLQRKTPLKRTDGTLIRTPLSRGDAVLRRTPLKQIGARKKRETRETSGTRAKYRAAHPACEIGYVLRANARRSEVIARAANACTGSAEGVHERRSRAANPGVEGLKDPVNMMSSCNICNGWCADHPDSAHDMGLVVYSYEDPADVPVKRMPGWAE